MEEIYFQTVIPRVTYCIGAWGSWSVAIFTEMENSHIKVGTNIHKNSKNYLDHEVLDLIKWQDWGYLYKRKLVIEFFQSQARPEQQITSVCHFYWIEAQRPSPWNQTYKTDLERNSFYFRTPTVWKSLDSSIRLLNKLDNYKQIS